MAAKLGNRLLDTSLSFANPNVGVVATSDDEDNIKIMIYYMAESIECKLDNFKIRINIEGLKGDYQLNHYRIDKNNSNSHTRWIELGKPENPNQIQREQIHMAGCLSLYYPSETLNAVTSYSEDIVMSPNAVSLVELIKINK